MNQCAGERSCWNLQKRSPVFLEHSALPNEALLLFTWPRISQVFSLLQVSSAQRCLAHQCQAGAFPVPDSSRYSLSHLTGTVLHQSQCDLRKDLSLLLFPGMSSCFVLILVVHSPGTGKQKAANQKFQFNQIYVCGSLSCQISFRVEVLLTEKFSPLNHSAFGEAEIWKTQTSG